MVDTLDTFAERLKFLRKKAGMSLAAVGKQTGVSAQAVHKWETGGKADSDKELKLAQLFRVDRAWLAFGNGTLPDKSVPHPADRNPEKSYYPPTVPEMPETGIFVPLLPPSRVTTWIEGKGSILTVHTGSWIACPARHSEETFALRIMDDSMENLGSKSSYSEGTIVFIDPKVKPRSKSCVVFTNFRMDEQDVLFRQLLIKNGELFRAPLNPTWPEGERKVASYEFIVGTVIGKWCYE